MLPRAKLDDHRRLKLFEIKTFCCCSAAVIHDYCGSNFDFCNLFRFWRLTPLAYYRSNGPKTVVVLSLCSSLFIVFSISTCCILTNCYSCTSILQTSTMQKEDRIVPESGMDKQPTNTSERKRRVVVIMNCTGVVFASAVLFALIALTRYREIFPTTMKAFDLRNPSLNHPQKPYTISGQLNVIISAVVVFLVIINWFYWERRTLKNHLFGILCTVYLATLGACFMILLVNCTKNLAGNLRPFFLSACNPNISLVEELEAKNSTWVDEDLSRIICTNKKTLKYRWSFPSGHSAEAFYSVILSILIIQYTKNIRTRYSESASLVLPLKATIQFILFAFACWVGITRTLDEHHFWWDVLAGSLLGSFIATVMFFWFLKPVMENTDCSFCRAKHSCCGIRRLRRRPSSYEVVSVKDEEL